MNNNKHDELDGRYIDGMEREAALKLAIDSFGDSCAATSTATFLERARAFEGFLSTKPKAAVAEIRAIR